MTQLALDPDAAPSVGATFGVEEEYHVIDPDTFELRDEPDLTDAALHGRLGPRIHAEIATTQLEAATGVCATVEELRAEIVAGRREALAAAAGIGATVLAASTHPTGSWAEQRLTPRDRYIELYERWGVLALQQGVICGCHVHVGVPDVDTAVAVMDRARPYLPLHLALTGSSPFYEGTDTGYDSYRTQWFSRWPINGPTEPLGDEITYRRVVEGLRRAGAVADSSNLYWDVRPSARHPTVEYRIGDVCTSADDVVLHAVLLRALTVTLARRAAAGEPVPDVRPELLRVARWRAARFGVTAGVFDPVTGEVIDAGRAIGTLVRELEPELAARGETETVRALLRQVLARGTSAQRQRSVLHRTGDTRAVVAFLLREGSA